MPDINKKQAIVDEVKQKLEKASSAILVDSRGLTVEQDTALRKALRESGVDYKVYKNTIMRFAAEGTRFEPLKDQFKGPSALAISYDDPMAAAREINKLIKTMPNLEFKAGMVEGVFYDAQGVQAVANIPSREVLLSKLLGSFKSPIASFARVINAIAEKDGGNETA